MLFLIHFELGFLDQIMLRKRKFVIVVCMIPAYSL